MAITVTHRGSGGSSTNASSYNLSPASNFGSNSFAVLAIAGKKTSAPSDPIITDTDSNVWTVRLHYYDATIDDSLIFATCDSQSLTTGDTITINWGTTMLAYIYHIYEVTPDTNPVKYKDSNSAVFASNGTITTSSMITGEVVFGAVVRNSALDPTQDSDTLNGSWSSQNSLGSGSDLIRLSSQNKVVTGDGAQTYNIGTSLQNIIAYLHLTDIPDSSIDPFGQFGIFGI